MGGLISTVAFPVPQLPESFYDELKRRSDVVYMKTSSDERIPAVHVRNRRGSSPGKMTLLYSHGNAEDIGLHLDYIDDLADATGADVFSYEYVGYSLSRLEGETPSEAACLRSGYAAWVYLVEYLQIPPSQIIIFGRSIGSGPAVDLASMDKVEGTNHSPLDAAGVLLQSPIESGARAVLGHWPSVTFYYLDIFRNYEKIEKIRAPVAIMHGTCDSVVPVANGRALHSMAKRPFDPLWIEGVGHNDMPQEICFRYAGKFVKSLQSSGRS